MSKNIILDGQTYNGVSEVELPVSDGTALFKDEDEIIVPTGTKQITANGDGIDVAEYAAVDVNVSAPAPEINLQEKTASANGEVTPDEGYDGLSKVTVAVSGDAPTYQEKTVDENGVVLPDAGYDALSKVTVNVEADLPELTNPASVSDILTGKEAIDGNGAKLTGTCTYDADTSDANAVASDIAQGKTAYVNGVKIIGTASGGGGEASIEPFDIYEFNIPNDILYNDETGAAIREVANFPAHDALIAKLTEYSGKTYNNRFMLNGMARILVRSEPKNPELIVTDGTYDKIFLRKDETAFWMLKDGIITRGSPYQRAKWELGKTGTVSYKGDFDKTNDTNGISYSPNIGNNNIDIDAQVAQYQFQKIAAGDYVLKFYDISELWE